MKDPIRVGACCRYSKIVNFGRNDDHFMMSVGIYGIKEDFFSEIKLYHQRRLKNFTVLMDKMLNRKYCDYLHPHLVTFLDSVESHL